MPAESDSQRKWAFAVKGEKWARKHHFDTPGKLPKHKRSSGRSMKRKKYGSKY